VECCSHPPNPSKKSLIHLLIHPSIHHPFVFRDAFSQNLSPRAIYWTGKGGSWETSEYRLPLPLEVRAVTHNSDTLVHHPFANTEVLIDGRAKILWFDLLRLEARSGQFHLLINLVYWKDVFSLNHAGYSEMCHMWRGAADVEEKEWDGMQYVRPVDRLTPARKAESRMASKL
jgi:hypothetical protein